MRRENLRISGLPESQEENEEVLMKEVMPDRFELSAKKVATCCPHGAPQRLPRPNQRMDTKISQENQNPADLLSGFCQEGSGTSTLIAGLNTRGEDAYKWGFINDDLTTMWYKVLMAAKKAPDVKGVNSKHGNVVCKMNDAPLKLFVLQMASLMIWLWYWIFLCRIVHLNSYRMRLYDKR